MEQVTTFMPGPQGEKGDQGIGPGAGWGCDGIEIGANGTEVGTGVQNTADILAGCNEDGIAARIVENYELNGFKDWFLPSLEELSLLYH